ncbi:MAG: uracil-DNA glycosylase [bacterium]
MNNKKQYLKEMEIDLWQKKLQAVAGWPELEKRVATCVLCELHKTRTKIVFGVGNKNAEVMFIGEAPGANEDLQGEPFVGRAGMLLNSMVQSIGLSRCDVYIANILKCRPPNNRDPEPQEVKLCTPYLEQQIALIQPKILVAVGRIAAQFLLNTTESMGNLRGRTYQYGSQNTPLMVTYHPAYLLRSPSEKRKAYVDFLLIKKMIGEIA